MLAIDEAELEVAAEDACAAILSGYAEGLERGGKPYVLAGKHDANIHLAAPIETTEAVRADLARRGATWLGSAAAALAEQAHEDWRDFSAADPGRPSDPVRSLVETGHPLPQAPREMSRG